MNKLGKCFNSDDLISGVMWSDLEGKDPEEQADDLLCGDGERFGTSPCDPIVFLLHNRWESGNIEIEKAYCGVRENIIESMLSTPRVYSWSHGQNMGMLLYPFYRFPLLQIYLDEGSLHTINDTNHWAYYIVKRDDALKLGTGGLSYVSALHGEILPVYNAVPVSEREIYKFINDKLYYNDIDRMPFFRKLRLVEYTLAKLEEQIPYVNNLRRHDEEEIARNVGVRSDYKTFSEKLGKYFDDFYPKLQQAVMCRIYYEDTPTSIKTQFFRVERDKNGMWRNPKNNKLLLSPDLFREIVGLENNIIGYTINDSNMNVFSQTWYDRDSFIYTLFHTFIANETVPSDLYKRYIGRVHQTLLNLENAPGDSVYVEARIDNSIVDLEIKFNRKDAKDVLYIISSQLLLGIRTVVWMLLTHENTIHKIVYNSSSGREILYER